MNIVLIGATSAIVTAVARKYAAAGSNFILVGRNEGRLEIVTEDLRGRGAGTVSAMELDFSSENAATRLVAEVTATMETIDLVLIGHGVLPDQNAAATEYTAFLRQFEVNCLSVIRFCQAFKPVLEAQQSGCLAVIGSVAGDRGRKSNYAYGTAKAAVDVYLAGLRNELFEKGVHVLTIKPGFVATPMTADLAQGPLFAQPDTVAADIVRAVKKRKDVLYTPWFWCGIMALIKAIPERIFKRLSL